MACIAHKFVVGDELPKVPYRTLLDYYVDGCFVLQFLAVASAFVVYYMDKYHVRMNEMAPTPESLQQITDFPWILNWVLLGVNVALWVLLVAWVLLKMHFVKTDVEHWLRIADRINSGETDGEYASVKDMQKMTAPPAHWGRSYLRGDMDERSGFLHFGGRKKTRASLSHTKGPASHTYTEIDANED